LADRKGPTLQKACPLPFDATGAVLRLIEGRRGEEAGVFLLFRGDSHMRIAFQQLVRSVTAELDPLVAMKFEGNIGKTPAQHADHLFCCASLPNDHNSSGFFTGCSVEAAGRDFVDMREAVASKILPRRRQNSSSSSSSSSSPAKKGGPGDDDHHHAAWPVCIGLVFEVNFKDHDLLSHWLEHEGGAVAPSALIANGGAHYAPAPRLGAEFNADLAAWLAGIQHAMETQTASPESAALAAPTTATAGKGGEREGVETRLILTSSPPNGWVAWEPQSLAYESMRRAVAAASSASSSSKSRTSFLDLHALARVDACGFTNQFPHRGYEVTRRDACGHHYHCSDTHLKGGAYVHLVELALNLAAANRRRCDPLPYEPKPPLLSEAGQGGAVETTAGGGGPRAAYLESLAGRKCNPFTGKCQGQSADAMAALLQT
jgi:hypothetical protein